MFPTLLLMLVVVEVGLPLLLFLLRDRVIFLPSARPTPEEGLRFLNGRADVELVRIPRSDGRLLAAYDARPKGDSSPAGPVVIFFHGNAGNIGGRAPLLEDFVAGTRARTVLFDYSGYGGNSGSPSEEEVRLDGVAVFEYLIDDGVAPERIVLYGESLGAAVALAVAADRRCAGVVAQSAFSSLSSMALRAYPWMPLVGLLARGAFPSTEMVGEMDVPLLVVHGTRDRIVPFSEGERLHAAAPSSTEFLPVEGAGHNDFFAVAGADYLALLGERIRAWTRPVDN